jgi:hypothetical protein
MVEAGSPFREAPAPVPVAVESGRFGSTSTLIVQVEPLEVA